MQLNNYHQILTKAGKNGSVRKVFTMKILRAKFVPQNTCFKKKKPGIVAQACNRSPGLVRSVSGLAGKLTYPNWRALGQYLESDS